MAKVVKPTGVEKALIEGRLMRKYPQMFTPATKKLYNKKPGVVSRMQMAMARSIGNKSKKQVTTMRTTDITSRLKSAGLSDDEIKRLRGKK